jgi:hypothetical protein
MWKARRGENLSAGDIQSDLNVCVLFLEDDIAAGEVLKVDCAGDGLTLSYNEELSIPG